MSFASLAVGMLALSLALLTLDRLLDRGPRPRTDGPRARRPDARAGLARRGFPPPSKG